jgi:glycerol-3-phosphate responsive antiterminator
MKKFDINKLIDSIEFGKGIIRTKEDAIDYIKFGYNPIKMLHNFTIIDNQALQFILAEIAKTNLN